MLVRKAKACPFCIGIKSKTRRIVAQQRDLVALESRFKVADMHLLLMPVGHVEHNIGMKDIGLLQAIKTWSGVFIPERLIIHPWPFNSVDHFHVHALSGQFVNPYRSWTHSGFRPFSITLDDAIERLRSK